MQERALELLGLPDHILFRAGGCHVFALVLHQVYRFPLLRITGSEAFNHVACNPEADFVSDYFGWFSRPEFIQEERLEDRGICFTPISEKDLRKDFIFVRGKGYYAHNDFLIPATDRARKWIAKNHEFFDGTRRGMIPGVSRITAAGNDEMGELSQ